MGKLRLREVKNYNQSNTDGECEARCKLRQTDPRAYIFFPLCHIVSWRLSDSSKDNKQVSPGRNGQDVVLEPKIGR